jgi:hypothetical protein
MNLEGGCACRAIRYKLAKGFALDIPDIWGVRKMT